MATTPPGSQPGDRSASPTSEAGPPHPLLVLVMILALAPLLCFSSFAAFISGPSSFSGAYSSQAGQHALLLAGLVLTASLGWAWFFAGYRQTAQVSLLGLLLTVSSALLAAFIVYVKLEALSAGPPLHSPDEPDRLDPWLVTLLAGTTIVGVTAAAARHRPRLRPLAVVTTALYTLAGAWLVVAQLTHGGRSLSALVVLGSPAVLGLAVLTTLWFHPHARRTARGEAPGGS